MRLRSALFVPGIRPDLVAKATRWQPDVLVVDLEDAVPDSEKVEAREVACRAIEELDGALPVWVRVNGPSTEWFEGDVDALPEGIDALVVPKWEGPLDLPHPVVAGIETVRGVDGARETLTPATRAVYFGAEDYIADLGGVRTPSNLEVLHARAAVAVAARLARLPALDLATLDFSDDERFLRESSEARALGFVGKLCIHPRQVALANRGFAPSAEEVDRAARLLAHFDAAGGRAVAFEGQMVDEVVAAHARAVLARA